MAVDLLQPLLCLCLCLMHCSPTTGPLRDAADMERLDMEPERAASLDASVSTSGSFKLPDSSAVHHFGAAMAAMNQASVGIEVFNGSAIKGIASPVAAGIVENKPADIARWVGSGLPSWYSCQLAASSMILT